MFEWDAKKAAANLAKHGVAFDAIHDFDWETCVEAEDDRFDYGEHRFVAIRWLNGELHAVTFTWRGDRKADKRDRRAYARAKEKA